MTDKKPANDAALRVYYDADADMDLIRGKKVAVIGYGSQGHAHALNLKDSGVKQIRIALREGSPSTNKVKEAGFEIANIADAAAWADVIMVLTPDEIQADLYKDLLEPNMKQGAALGFAHGLCVHFGQIEPRADLDVFLVAPKGPGPGVRAAYSNGGGLPCLIAVHQSPTGKARDIALSYASAIGCGGPGMIETSFREECVTDLFGEQAVLCGGIPEMIQAGYETLVDAGYAPEMAYFECLHETKLIVDLLYEGGLSYMRSKISNTAEYGGYVTGKRIVNDAVKDEMKAVLADIESGAFARDWIGQTRAGGAKFKALRDAAATHPIEQAGQKVRAIAGISPEAPLKAGTIRKKLVE